MISQVTHGSMTPDEIAWGLPLALGRQLESMWWMIYYDNTGNSGRDVRSLYSETRTGKDRVAG